MQTGWRTLWSCCEAYVQIRFPNPLRVQSAVWKVAWKRRDPSHPSILGTAMQGRRWPGAVVPYQNISAPEDKVKKTLALWKDKTPISFRQREQGDVNYVRIVSSSDCSSVVGMSGTGHRQLRFQASADRVGSRMSSGTQSDYIMSKPDRIEKFMLQSIGKTLRREPRRISI